MNIEELVHNYLTTGYEIIDDDAPTEEVGENQINIFGHIHDKPLDERFDKKNHICVSCDVVDYTPVSIKIIQQSSM